MKKKIGIAVVVVAIAWLVIFGTVTALNLLSWRNDYVEAEPFVEIVWPLSSEMEKFEKNEGRRPKSLSELEESTGLDLTEIKEFEHRFYEEGPLVFTIRINETHGFKFDDSYSPSWNTQE
ncbi:hypothetical protein DDZ13_15130 [Coraliomargarita sinensis]|uniref:Uncharacterized protein n=1 Tax=Coraliomargarita sinensis TaxID=2174842 RepID=A0A317ZFW5_9BACT|nr:hypothetical protein [Coraliomargarita sinensis]PXA02828.1 hypothetical protein DDZ13_15130 [Coraliomargarita sinensis]